MATVDERLTNIETTITSIGVHELAEEFTVLGHDPLALGETAFATGVRQGEA